MADEEKEEQAVYGYILEYKDGVFEDHYVGTGTLDDAGDEWVRHQLSMYDPRDRMVPTSTILTTCFDRSKFTKNRKEPLKMLYWVARTLEEGDEVDEQWGISTATTVYGLTHRNENKNPASHTEIHPSDRSKEPEAEPAMNFGDQFYFFSKTGLIHRSSECAGHYSHSITREELLKMEVLAFCGVCKTERDFHV